MVRSGQKLNSVTGKNASGRSSLWSRLLGIARHFGVFRPYGLFSRRPYGQSDDLGRLGEQTALHFLRRQGFRLLMRNFRTPQGEIDLVMRQNRTVVFVEVKTRQSEEFVTAEHLVTPQKQTRITAAARQFIHRNQLSRFPARFDVVLVVPGESCSPEIRHYPNAFSA